MFILIETSTFDCESRYLLIGTFNDPRDAQKVMWELSDRALSDDYYDTRETDADEMAQTVFVDGCSASDNIRWVIFDADNPKMYDFA